MILKTSKFFFFLWFLSEVKCSKNCRKIDSKNPAFRSIVYSESHGSGFGSQLSVYALMSQLRHEFNFDTFVSRECRAVLSNVFTVTSLSDVPVFEDTFCVEKLTEAGNFEAYARDVQDLVEKTEFRSERTIWLWPHKAKISKTPNDKTSKPSSYHSNDVFLQGYRYHKFVNY